MLFCRSAASFSGLFHELNHILFHLFLPTFRAPSPLVLLPFYYFLSRPVHLLWTNRTRNEGPNGTIKAVESQPEDAEASILQLLFGPYRILTQAKDCVGGGGEIRTF